MLGFDFEVTCYANPDVHVIGAYVLQMLAFFKNVARNAHKIHFYSPFFS